jgi:metal-sulfur cluster biosynthetic enzyme
MISDPERTAALRPRIVDALSKVFDPEIPGWLRCGNSSKP